MESGDYPINNMPESHVYKKKTKKKLLEIETRAGKLVAEFHHVTASAFFFSSAFFACETTTTKLREPFVVRSFRTYIHFARCSVLEDRLAGAMNDSSEVAALRPSQFVCPSCAAIASFSPRYVAILNMICAKPFFFFFRSAYLQLFGGHRNGFHNFFFLFLIMNLRLR